MARSTQRAADEPQQPEPEVPTVPVAPGAADAERTPPEPIIPGVTEQERIDLIEAAEDGGVVLAPVTEAPFISAGVAGDLATQGWAGDPATGGMFRRDAETGEVTFTPRGGEETVITAADLPGVLRDQA